MAGENVVASGAIAVNLTINDPQGAFTGGGMPGAPGAGGTPGGSRRSSTEQLAERGLKDYAAQKTATSALSKFLPMLGGVLGIAAIAQHSMIISQSVGALFKILGALVDVVLLPLMPLIAAALSTVANIISNVAEVMKDPKEFVKAVWGRIEGFGATAWTAIQNYALERWEIIKNGALAVWKLLPEEIQTFIKTVASAIAEGAESAWIFVKDAFKKAFPWILRDESGREEKTLSAKIGETIIPGSGKYIDEVNAFLGEKVGSILDFFGSPGFKSFMIGAAGGGTVGATTGTLGGPAAPITVPLLGLLGSIFGGLIALATQQELNSRNQKGNTTNNVSVTIEGGLSAEEQKRRLEQLLHDPKDERYP